MFRVIFRSGSSFDGAFTHMRQVPSSSFSTQGRLPVLNTGSAWKVHEIPSGLSPYPTRWLRYGAPSVSASSTAVNHIL